MPVGRLKFQNVVSHEKILPVTFLFYPQKVVIYLMGKNGGIRGLIKPEPRQTEESSPRC